ncbi:MAG: aminotransferase [Pseudomonadota bacterium]
MTNAAQPISAAMAATFPPPVPEAQRWLQGVTFGQDRPLLNVSQAAPVLQPPEGLRAAMADAVMKDASAHLYGPVLGHHALRAAVAERWRAAYAGQVAADQIAITAGCNQAFAAALSTLAGAGDEVILPVPWYFNHKMWLDMSGAVAVPMPVGPDMIPDPAGAARLITPRTRAIAIVTPNNPAGVEYPAGVVGAFRDLARAHGIALIIDETYRDFDSRDGPVHDLFQDPDWDQTIIQLYSFSKAYRLTGHRVGAIAASSVRLAEIEKFQDTVAICPPALGQIGALWGLRNLSDWLEGERAEILARRAAMEHGIGATASGWQLAGSGAYFAYLRHPFDWPARAVAPALVRAAAILCLPGDMFYPTGDRTGEAELRIAFANIDRDQIALLIERLNDPGLEAALGAEISGNR